MSFPFFSCFRLLRSDPLCFILTKLNLNHCDLCPACAQVAGTLQVKISRPATRELVSLMDSCLLFLHPARLKESVDGFTESIRSTR